MMNPKRFIDITLDLFIVCVLAGAFGYGVISFCYWFYQTVLLIH